MIFIVYTIGVIILGLIASYEAGKMSYCERGDFLQFCFIVAILWPLVIFVIVVGFPFYLMMKAGENCSKG